MARKLPTSQEAKEIAEHLLSITGKALMSGDFDDFASVFHLPHRMTTDEESHTLQSLAELEVVFRNVRERHAQQGISTLKRHVEAAEFTSQDRISTTHLTTFFRGEERVGPSTPTLSTLIRIEGHWLVSEAIYGGTGDLDHSRSLSPTRASQIAAHETYQAFIDKMSEALLEMDPGKLAPLIGLPLHVKTEVNEAWAHCPVVVSRYYSEMAASYAELGVNGSTRIVREAKFTAADEIVGLHETNLMRDGKRILPPYPTRLHLKQGPDQNWQARQISIGIRNTVSNLARVASVGPNPQAPALDSYNEGHPK